MSKIICVIDDCTSTLFCMKFHLDKMGYIVHTFKWPLEAVKNIPNINPDIILSDYMMFDLDGLSVIEQLKKLKVEAKYLLFSSLTDPKLASICEENNITFYNKQNDKEKLIEDLKCLI